MITDEKINSPCVMIYEAIRAATARAIVAFDIYPLEVFENVFVNLKLYGLKNVLGQTFRGINLYSCPQSFSNDWNVFRTFSFIVFFNSFIFASFSWTSAF